MVFTTEDWKASTGFGKLSALLQKIMEAIEETDADLRALNRQIEKRKERLN